MTTASLCRRRAARRRRATPTRRSRILRLGKPYREADPEAEEAAYQEADPEADGAAYQEALAAGRVREIPLELVAGRVAESLPTGPGLAAGWRTLAPPTWRTARWRESPHRSAGWLPGLRRVSSLRWLRSRRGRRSPIGGPRSTRPGRPGTVTTDASARSRSRWRCRTTARPAGRIGAMSSCGWRRRRGAFRRADRSGQGAG